MRRKATNWMVTCAAAAALLAAAPPGVAAQAPAPTEARIRELIRVAAERAGANLQTPAPTPQPSAENGRPMVRLTLDDAVKLALERNLDISVQRLSPQTFDFSLASLRAAYHPSVTSQVVAQSATNPSTSTIAGNAAGTGITQRVQNYNGGLAQNIPWGGGSLSVQLNNTRTKTTSATALFNPSFNPNWSAQYTQPLLRGFAVDSTREQLVVTKLNQDISEVQLQATIINTLSNVRNAYWDYVFAVQSVDVAKQSVALADQLVKDNQTRVEVGTMAPIDVVQAQAQAATQRQNLVTAEATQRTAELALKRLIVAGTQDPNWSASIDPVDRPDFRPVPIDVDAAVRKALSARTDLTIAQKELQANTETMKFLHNQVLPQADLVARYGLLGLGGTQFITEGSGITRQVIGTVPGGYGDALSSLLGANYPQWNVTVNFSYPLGTSTADAAVARAKIQMSQTEAQLHQIELQIATDVTNAAVQAQSNIERVQAAQAARDLAQQQLDAENSKFEVGMSTNYLVVQAQRDLATAQNNELQAILAYRKSLVELDRLQQTTLQSSNVTVVSSGGLNNTAVGSGRPTVVAGGGGGN
ncbi:MAG: TolC family protein [Betaproteobacteria bacterium]